MTQLKSSTAFQAANVDLASYCEELARRARAASRLLATVLGAQKNDWLHAVAAALVDRGAEILEANRQDLAMALELGLAAAAVLLYRAAFAT